MRQLPMGDNDSLRLPSGLSYRIEELERKVAVLELAQQKKNKAIDDKLATIEIDLGKIKLPKL